jgi:type VI secretion system protein ImpH
MADRDRNAPPDVSEAQSPPAETLLPAPVGRGSAEALRAEPGLGTAQAQRDRVATSLAPLMDMSHRFDLFAALRLAEAAFRDHPRLGEAKRARDEAIRLGQPPHMIFPPAQIAGVAREQHGRLRLSTYAFGLFGPQGPLPLHVTRHALVRSRNHRDPTFADFCDLFHHRMIALFYRAWGTARPSVQFDRPERDRFARRVGAIAGLPSPAFLERSEMPDRFALFTAGLLSMQTRPPEAIAKLVALLFKVPVAIREFVGAWLDIPLPARTRLGLPNGASVLGVDAVVGTRTFARHHRFRIVLGPLDLATFLRFLPVGGLLPRLRALVRHAVGLDLDWDVQLVLRKDEVPTARLGGATRLGWTSWLATGERGKDADDLVLMVSA